MKKIVRKKSYKKKYERKRRSSDPKDRKLGRVRSQTCQACEKKPFEKRVRELIFRVSHKKTSKITSIYEEKCHLKFLVQIGIFIFLQNPSLAEYQLVKLFNWINLRPRKHNLSKRNKIDIRLEVLQKIKAHQFMKLIVQKRNHFFL